MPDKNGSPKDDGPIESLRQRLYSRGNKDMDGVRRTRLGTSEHAVPEGWDRPPQLDKFSVPQQTPKKKSFVSRFFIFSLVFFGIAVVAALFVIGGGTNIISSRNVNIAVSGPATIGGGEVLALQLEITNRNRTPLEVADLLVEFPEGTRDPNDLSKELVRLRETLGDIAPGEKITKTVEAVLFGEENSARDIVITVEYRVASSNAIFYKERKYEVEISSAPLNLSISVPREINAGGEVPVEVEVASNAASVIEDVLLAVEYPFGFERTGGSPQPTYGEDIWSLGDIEPGGRRTVRIVGTIQAQDEEERTFRFEAGIASERDEKLIETPFITALRSVVVRRPFIGLAAVLGGESGEEYVAQGGQSVRTDISWKNNLPDSIRNAEITVEFSGVALDKSSVSTTNGFYRSIDNTVLWDKELLPQLGLIAPGETGRVTLDFSSFSLSERNDLRNPEILLTITMTGDRQGDSGSTGRVSTSVEKRVLVATELSLVSRAVHFVGPFNNSGPIPPRAERETTYTVIWSVTNSANDVSGATVRATLPAYVRWLGVTSPSSENISYNADGGEVVWRPDTIRSGTGFGTLPREVAFQVAVVPSVSQIGSQPIIVNTTALNAFDNFAEATVADGAAALTTRLSTDPQFSTGDGRVVQ